MEWIKKNILYVGLAAAALIAAFAAMVFIYAEKEGSNPAAELEAMAAVEAPAEKTQAESSGEAEEAGGTMLVDVKGAVTNAGVYEADPGDRVKDLIEKAGGFSKEADINKINLAQKLADEMVIYVPKIGEETGNAMSTALPDSGQGETDGKIAVNTATVEELDTLPGIGPSRAQAIIDYREENGPFKKLEDLLNVTGIGEKSLEKLKDYIVIQ